MINRTVDRVAVATCGIRRGCVPIAPTRTGSALAVAAGLHPDRAPGGDPDHPARQRRRAADRAAGPHPPPGSEAARILQGALVGARDAAIHNNTPSGIRLLPDPAFPI